MGQRLIITEEEKNNIKKQYGMLVNEQLFGGMLPNPTKSITLNLPLNDVDDIIAYLPRHILKDNLGIGGYLFVKKEDLFDTIQYKISAGEMASLGVFIIITLTQIDNDKTKVDIEIRRKVGAFDRAIEVQKASQHMDNILKGLSFANDPKNKEKYENIYKGQPSILGMGFKNHQEHKDAGEPDVHLMYDNGFRNYKEYKDAGSPKLKTRSELKKEKEEIEKAERDAKGIKPSLWDKLFGN
jgi:hypothetical protein